jgi:hypothetical protein
MITSIGWDQSLNWGHQRAYCSLPRRYMRVGIHGGMNLTEKNSWLVHQSSLEILPGESSGSKQEESVNGNINFALQSTCSYLQVIFTCRKILQHGASDFTFLAREGVNLSPLKIHRLGRIWIHEPWIQWQALYPLQHQGHFKSQDFHELLVRNLLQTVTIIQCNINVKT